MSAPPNPLLSPQIDALIRDGHKIEAIKLAIFHNPGLGLREAKNAVEARERVLLAGAAPAEAAAQTTASGASRAGLPPDAIEALNRGRTVEAIKRVRLATGVDLRTAKRWVDAYSSGARGDAVRGGTLGARHVDSTVVRGDSSGKPVLWALAVVVVAAAVWWAMS